MSQKTINQQFLKVSSRMEIEPTRKIELGQEMIIAIKASAVAKEVKDNQDGTVDIIYKIKPIEVQFDK